MDWKGYAFIIAMILLFISFVIKEQIEAKKKAKEREIIERILRQNDEYEKMNEKLKKEIKKLKNENKN